MTVSTRGGIQMPSHRYIWDVQAYFTWLPDAVPEGCRPSENVLHKIRWLIWC